MQFTNSAANYEYAPSENLVGKKNVMIPMRMDVHQKEYGWHPDQPVVVKREKTAENARLFVALPAEEAGQGANWRNTYRCCGEVYEGYDKFSGTNANAGNMIGCLMNGTANAGRVLLTEINENWPMLTDIVVDIEGASAATTNSKEVDTVKKLNGKTILYFGYRPFDTKKGDKNEDIIGKAYQGKAIGSRTATIYINTCL